MNRIFISVTLGAWLLIGLSSAANAYSGDEPIVSASARQKNDERFFQVHLLRNKRLLAADEMAPHAGVNFTSGDRMNYVASANFYVGNFCGPYPPEDSDYVAIPSLVTREGYVKFLESKLGPPLPFDQPAYTTDRLNWQTALRIYDYGQSYQSRVAQGNLSPRFAVREKKVLQEIYTSPFLLNYILTQAFYNLSYLKCTYLDIKRNDEDLIFRQRPNADDFDYEATSIAVREFRLVPPEPKMPWQKRNFDRQLINAFLDPNNEITIDFAKLKLVSQENGKTIYADANQKGFIRGDVGRSLGNFERATYVALPDAFTIRKRTR